MLSHNSKNLSSFSNLIAIRNLVSQIWSYRYNFVVAVLLVIVPASIWFGLAELNVQARLAFIAFGLAIIGWVFTQVNDTYVALAAALGLVILSADDPNHFFATLGDPMIWLLFAAFIIAAGVKASGLSQRLTLAVAGRARSVSQLFYLLTAVILASAFVIPATSGRAALMVPIFLALSNAINNPRIVRAMAILFPTAILLSAVASMIGAGAHLVTVEFIWHLAGERISFGRWLMLGLPLAIVSSFMSTWVILHLFLNRQERRQSLQLTFAQLAETEQPTGFTKQEGYVLGLVGLLVLLWVSEPVHGLNNTLVAVLGAIAVTAPKIGVIGFKDGVKGVNWNMLLFMAATLLLGESLTNSGGAEWLVQNMFATLQGYVGSTSWFIVLIVTIVSLLAHLVITSRTARASVLVPLVVLMASSLGYNPAALAFLSTAAAGFCLTLTVSAKPVTMFGQLDQETFSPGDLLRLSSVLIPLHVIIFAAFALIVWPLMGLPLTTEQRPTEAPQSPPTWQAEPLYPWFDIQPFTTQPDSSSQVDEQPPLEGHSLGDTIQFNSSEELEAPQLTPIKARLNDQSVKDQVKKLATNPELFRHQ